MEQDAVEKHAEQQTETEQAESPIDPVAVSDEMASTGADLRPSVETPPRTAGADRLFAEIAAIRETLNYLGSVLELQGIKLDRISTQSQTASSIPNAGLAPGDMPAAERDIPGIIGAENSGMLSAEDAESIAECVRIRLEGEFSSILFDVSRIADLLRELPRIGNTSQNNEGDAEEIQAQTSAESEASTEDEESVTTELTQLEMALFDLNVKIESLEQQLASNATAAADNSASLESLLALEERLLNGIEAPFAEVKNQLKGLATSAEARARGTEISAFAFKEMEVSLAAKIEQLADQLQQAGSEPPVEDAEEGVDPYQEHFAKLWRALDSKLEHGNRRQRLYDNVFYGLVVLLLMSNLAMMGWHFFLR